MMMIDQASTIVGVVKDIKPSNPTPTLELSFAKQSALQLSPGQR